MGMIWTTTDDPSDGWSSHWSNAPKPDKGQCPECGSFNTFEATLKTSFLKTKYKGHICRDCWNKFD